MKQYDKMSIEIIKHVFSVYMSKIPYNLCMNNTLIEFLENLEKNNLFFSSKSFLCFVFFLNHNSNNIFFFN